MSSAAVLGPLTPDQVLAMLPQQEPFRFVDHILELDEEHIVATYRFRPEADFYRGHFPGDPVTPGVILLEAVGQVGVVAWASTSSPSTTPGTRPSVRSPSSPTPRSNSPVSCRRTPR